VHPRIRAAAVLCGLCVSVAAAACDSTPLGIAAGIGGGSPRTLIVFGTASSGSTGAASAGITVTAEDSACTGTVYGTATATTNASGAYRVTVASSSARAGCVVVTGTMPGGGSSVTVPTGGVSFGTGDSVEVDLSFP
jgi:hypothetical protein